MELSIFKDHFTEKWLDRLSPILTSDYMENLLKYLSVRKKNHHIYPAQKDIFKVFQKCDYNDVKVVILGQDPYYTPNVADGIAFSSQIDGYIPPSLENIYKEIDSDIYDNKFNVFRCPSLEYLVKQGVFLYNTALTVEIAMPGSHIKAWKEFTDFVMEELNSSDPKVIMLWGNYAHKYEKFFDKEKHLIIKTAHPSPMAANRGGWFGEKPFSKANEFLKGIYGKDAEIEWRSPPF